MRILFCNIGWMKYYKGTSKDDRPVHGGSWVEENGDGLESMNFFIENNGYCYGYVSTKSNHGKDNQLHIEKFEGVHESDEYADNVLVIWGAKEDRPNGKNVIIGWYKNATILRKYEISPKDFQYNIIVHYQDCVLLPIYQRHKIVARSGSGGFSYGMGRSNIWFAQDRGAQVYVQNIINYINEYHGDNCVNK